MRVSELGPDHGTSRDDAVAVLRNVGQGLGDATT